MSELDRLLVQARQAEPDALSERETSAIVLSALGASSPTKLDRMIEAARGAEPLQLNELEIRRMTQHAAMTGAARDRSWTLRRLIVTTSVAAALAAAAVTLAITPRDPVNGGGREGVVPMRESTQLELITGDRLVVAADASFHVELAEASERRVRLDSGTVLFDVRPIEHGRFAVTTPMANVLVLGTVFSVNASERGTTVRVYEGRVEVRGQHRVRVVSAGGVAHFGEGEAAVDVLREEGEGAARLRLTNLGLRNVEPQRREETREEAHPPENARTRVSSSAMTREHQSSDDVTVRPRADEVRSWIATGAAERALAEAENAIRSGEVDPWRMVEGDALRALGRPLDAALAYRRAASELASPRRQQAGFLEARLRANELSDPEGALEALRDAGVTGASSPLRERGIALEVQLLMRLDRRSEIIPIAEMYVHDYPDGPQVETMRAYLRER